MVLFLYNRQVEGLLCGLVVVFVFCRSLGWRFGVSRFCCGCAVFGVPFLSVVGSEVRGLLSCVVFGKSVYGVSCCVSYG